MVSSHLHLLDTLKTCSVIMLLRLVIQTPNPTNATGKRGNRSVRQFPLPSLANDESILHALYFNFLDFVGPFPSLALKPTLASNFFQNEALSSWNSRTIFDPLFERDLFPNAFTNFLARRKTLQNFIPSSGRPNLGLIHSSVIIKPQIDDVLRKLYFKPEQMLLYA